MTTYLLDTNVIVELLRKNKKIRDQINEVGLNKCFISEITIVELLYGAEKSGNTDKMREVKWVEETFKQIPVRTAFHDFAKIKVLLEKQQSIIDTFDLLIGATALANNHVVVTHNAKHLQRIPGLTLEDWQ